MESEIVHEKLFEVDVDWCKKIVKDVHGNKRVIIVRSPNAKAISPDLSVSINKEIEMEFPQLDELVVSEQKSDVVEDKKKTAVKMAFIGAGQGGGKVADEFFSSGYNRVLLVNTTAQDMAGLSCKNQVIIGKGISGAGKNQDAGKKAAEENREDILRACKTAFGSDVDYVVVCTSSAGGTGSGSTPVLVEVAGDYLKSIGKEQKVGVIVSLPKKAEGAAALVNSQKLMGKLFDMVESKKVSPLVVCDNEKILKMFPKVSIAEFFKVANKNIVGLFNVFNELAAQSSPYSSLDVADYKTILDSGTIVFGMTPLSDVSSNTVIAEAIERNVKGGLLADGLSLQGATHAGAILVATKEKLGAIPQASFDMAFETLSRVIGGKNLILHSGIYEGGESLGNRVMVYSVVGGVK